MSTVNLSTVMVIKTNKNGVIVYYITLTRTHSQTGTIEPECSLFPYFMNNHILYHTHKDSQMDSQTGTIECSLFPYFMNNRIL